MKTRLGRITLWVLTLGVGFGIPGAWAEGVVARREENQQNRIAQGIGSGQLTAGETARLEHGEQKIERARERALSDGKLSWREKKRLRHRENKESHRIYRLKHNPRKAKP